MSPRTSVGRRKPVKQGGSGGEYIVLLVPNLTSAGDHAPKGDDGVVHNQLGKLA